MLDLTKAVIIYIDGKRVTSLKLGETSKPIFVDKNQLSFTILDSYKVKVSRRGDPDQIYNFSCEPSIFKPGYAGDIQFVDHEGNAAYVVLTDYVTSNLLEQGQRYNGKYISNGWYSDTSQSGGSYELSTEKYWRHITKGRYFGNPLEVRSDPYELDVNFVDDAIERVNKAFPTFHMSRTTETDTNDYITFGDYEDSFLGATWTHQDYSTIRMNHATLTRYYGEYTPDKTSSIYRRWMDTMVHEIGHTLGWPDQATHYPCLYDYSRDRSIGQYFQANDLAWLVHAFQGRGVDPSVFYVDRKGEMNMPVRARARLLSAPSTNTSDVIGEFDYALFDTLGKVEDFASNVVIATLTFDREETLDIGHETYIKYKIYTINIIDEEKGTLTHKEMKIHSSDDIEIKEGQVYKLYLQEYENTPCSPINTSEGIVEIKEGE